MSQNNEKAYNFMISYLEAGVKHEASDIHFVANDKTRLRVKNKLLELGDVIPAEALQEMIFSIMKEDSRQIFEEEKEVDFGVKIPGVGRFRANAYTTQGYTEAVLRVIKETVTDSSQLQLPDVINSLAEQHDGLVLVSGATGSGKSTTLSAMIDHINTKSNKRIFTVEDPVEIVHKNKQSVISQRSVGEDTASYMKALKSLLRQNPDVILIGEIRDKDTANIALQASETGHLVLSTIHASSAEETISRFAGLYPAEERANVKRTLAYTLKGVIAQRLITVDNEKMPIMEIMTSSKRIRDSIIADSNDETERESILSIIRDEGINQMNSLDQYLINLVVKNIIPPERAIAEAANKLWTRQNLHSRGFMQD